MKEFFKRHIFIFWIIIAVICLGSNLIGSFCEKLFEDSLTLSFLSEAVCRYIIAVLPLCVMVKWSYIRKSNKKSILSGFLVGMFCIFFIIPNLAPLLLVNPILFKVQWGLIFVIIINMLSIGILEESAMRGVVFSLLCEKWQDKKNIYLKAAVLSSFMFACAHLNWSVRYFLTNGNLTEEYFLDNLYQVYYTFCFGMLAAGVCIHARSIIPMVIWHALCDLSAFIVYGILPLKTLENYERTVTLQTVFKTYGILSGWKYGAEVVLAIINVLFVIIGVVLVMKAEKQRVESIQFCKNCKNILV